MARKRMFDSALINQDNFYDLPMEAKALYFLLGMEADDEGFINPKKVLRLYGGTEDSIKILILKNYLIPFKSGVVVITDWKRNNYLDKNKVKETIYVEEKSQLDFDSKSEKYSLKNSDKTESLTEVKPKLNESLPRIEENRVEEYRVVENSVTNNYSTIDSNVSNVTEAEIVSDEMVTNQKEMNIETLQSVCKVLEKEFGRPITPIETEIIKTWDYSIEIIKLAIAESISNGIFYIKYIDKILYHWKKANVRTVAEAKNYSQRFRQRKGEEKNKSDSKPSKWDEVRKKVRGEQLWVKKMFIDC